MKYILKLYYKYKLMTLNKRLKQINEQIHGNKLLMWDVYRDLKIELKVIDQDIHEIKQKIKKHNIKM